MATFELSEPELDFYCEYLLAIIYHFKRLATYLCVRQGLFLRPLIQNNNIWLGIVPITRNRYKIVTLNPYTDGFLSICVFRL